jgi:hypothetical protein
MAIETNFSFRHPWPVAEEAKLRSTGGVDLLGLLRQFTGAHPASKAHRKWSGTGFNMLWRPNFNNEFGAKDFF